MGTVQKEDSMYVEKLSNPILLSVFFYSYFMYLVDDHAFLHAINNPYMELRLLKKVSETKKIQDSPLHK